jgi:CRP-like cAMP-binding protein
MSTGRIDLRTGNLLIDALPESVLQQVRQKVKRVDLTVPQVLSTQGETAENVYFPATALISCRASGGNGEIVEIYSVGREGVADPAAILTGVAAVTAEVQIAGEAYQIKIDDLCGLVRNSMELTGALLKYAYTLAVRMVQATKCAMFHTVKQRLILWLLLAQREHGNDLPCTHQLVADALGTRRATVTTTLNDLEQMGIVERRRGRIHIRSTSELEANACECFHLIKAGSEPDLECGLAASRA